jgi:hypothetical protein
MAQASHPSTYQSGATCHDGPAAIGVNLTQWTRPALPLRLLRADLLLSWQ